MPKWIVESKRFYSEADRQQLAEQIAASPFISKNTLAGTFSESKGFAVSFTSEGVGELERRFSGLATFVRKTRSMGVRKKMLPWTERFFGPALEKCNAFYLNVLLLEAKDAIAPHVDATLAKDVGLLELRPKLVTVFYMAIPNDMKGGHLRIYGPNRKIRVIQPKPGQCIHFRGDLTHEITRIENDNGIKRMSLVLEQYHVPGEQLKTLDTLKLHSRAKFALHLKPEFRF